MYHANQVLLRKLLQDAREDVAKYRAQARGRRQGCTIQLSLPPTTGYLSNIRSWRCQNLCVPHNMQITWTTCGEREPRSHEYLTSDGEGMMITWRQMMQNWNWTRCHSTRVLWRLHCLWRVVQVWVHRWSKMTVVLFLGGNLSFYFWWPTHACHSVCMHDNSFA